MKALLRRLASGYGAGAIAVVIQQGVLWLAVALGAGGWVGSAWAGFSTAAVFPKLAWGGLLGLLFLLPVPRWSWWLRGLLFGLAPSLIWLWQTAGGPDAWPSAIGSSAFPAVVLAGALWGLAAAWLLESAG